MNEYIEGLLATNADTVKFKSQYVLCPLWHDPPPIATMRIPTKCDNLAVCHGTTGQ